MRSVLNFTVNDTSSVLNYTPYADGSLDGGWQTWFSISSYNIAPGQVPDGDSWHITASPGASVQLGFHGTAVYLYGNASCPYDIVVDGIVASQPPTEGHILYSVEGLTSEMHNISLVARPVPESDGKLYFDRALVSDSQPVGSIIPFVIDNQNTTLLQYNGSWTTESDPDVPNAGDSKPYKVTRSSSSSLSVNFTGSVAIAVNGPKTWGSWSYLVTLDGNVTSLHNASSWWLLGNALLYFQSGLDPDQEHSLQITGPHNAELEFMLNDITIYMQNATSGTANSSPYGHMRPAGQIAGPTVAVAVLLIGAVIALVWWNKKRRPNPYADTEILSCSPHSKPPLKPTGSVHRVPSSSKPGSAEENHAQSSVNTSNMSPVRPVSQRPPMGSPSSIPGMDAYFGHELSELSLLGPIFPVPKRSSTPITPLGLSTEAPLDVADTGQAAAPTAEETDRSTPLAGTSKAHR